MKLLYGTSNMGKLENMRRRVKGLNIQIVSLNDIDIAIDIEEGGKDPLENAEIKARAYYKLSGIPTFSCDSGLYIDGLEDKDQPGVYVRRIEGKYLNDEEFIEYYSKLILEMEREPRAKFKNAICLVMDEDHVFKYDGDDIADHFIMTDKVCDKRKAGFPMDSISLDIESGRYGVEVGHNCKWEDIIQQGFREFFIKSLRESM